LLVPIVAHAENYSFAVKGGVSLGSYEAGLLWTYIEQLRLRKENMNTFTGASAGSINALVAALRYCEQSDATDINDNLFRQTWDIGIDALLADNKSDGRFLDFVEDIANAVSKDQDGHSGKDRGGLFDRSALLGSLRKVEARIGQGKFREGCEVKLGIAVTKFVPDTYDVNGINVKNQRYVIPFIIKVVEGRLRFFNSHLFNDQERHRQRLNDIDRFIFLPEIKGEISRFDIYRAVMASSAFPIAFPPVTMAYCVARNANLASVSELCPQGYFYEESVFIDGGSFDNAPIGAAQRIAGQLPCTGARSSDCILGDDSDHTLVYINPGRIRERSEQASEGEASNHGPAEISGLTDYISIAGHIVDYGMSAELYRSLAEQRNSKGRLLSSSRFYPLVGDYAEHFGAFFDKAYRLFDYYVGVYDGIVNITRLDCLGNANQDECLSRQLRENLKHFDIENSDGVVMFPLLAAKEFAAYRELPSWAWLFEPVEILVSQLTVLRGMKTDRGKLVDIFLSLDRCNPRRELCGKNIKVQSFGHFLSSLTEIDRYQHMTQQMAASPNHWSHSLMDRMLKRSIEVERLKLNYLRDQKSQQNTFEDKERQQTQQYVVSGLEVLSLYGQSFFKRHSLGYWPASTSDDSCVLMFGGWSCLIPDEIGMHTDSVGGYLSWRYQFPGFFSRQSFDIGVDPVHFAIDTDDYASAEILMRYESYNIFITSIGIGAKLFRTIGTKDRFVNDQYAGITGKLGLFSDKIKISGSYRLFMQESDFRQRIEMTVGVTDVKGISRILFGFF